MSELIEMLRKADVSAHVGFGGDWESIYATAADALEARDKTIAELVEALTPFSDAVFNDNGEITVNFGSPELDDFFRAYSAIRRISQAQSKDKAE